MKYLLAAAIVILAPDARAQDSPTINGDCNVGTIGQNATNVTVTINCGSTTSAEQGSFPVALTADAYPSIVTWQVNPSTGWYTPFYFNPGIVEADISTFEVRLAGETITQYLDETFFGEELTLARGDYPFSMSFELFFSNGFDTTGRCNGILRIESSAALVPRMNIVINTFSGNATPANCGFVGMPLS